MDVPTIDKYHSVMNVSERFGPNRLGTLTCISVHHCNVLHDHTSDKYCKLPHCIHFTAKVCIIQVILKN